MKHTPETLKDLRDAIDAHLAGKRIQFQCNGIWNDTTNPMWGNYYYRPKPEPKTRPWSKPEDVPMNCWIRRKGYSDRHAGLVVYLFDFFLDVGGIGRLKYKELSDYEYSTDRMTWNKPEVTEP